MSARAAATTSTTPRRRPSSSARCEEETAGDETYVLRPCIVAGPDAQLLLRQLPPRPLLLPDPGTPFQLVHHDDVADALVAATLGKGPPGAYNLAGDGTITMGDLAAPGRHAFPVPRSCSGRPRSPRGRRWSRRSRSGSTPAACRS